MNGWTTAPFWSIAQRRDRTGYASAELLSVYREWGVVKRASRDDNFNRASEDLSDYKLVREGDLVLNKMKTWQGSLGVSPYEGIVSPAYFVCELSECVHGRFLHHLLRSRRYIAHYEAGSKGIRPNQWDLPYDVLRQIPVLLPPLEEQRRIADFLDDRVSRIDRIIAARREQLGLVDEEASSNLDELVRTPTAKIRPLQTLTDPARPIQYGIVLPGPHFPGGVSIIKGGDIGSGRLARLELNETDPEIESVYARSRVGPGDFVIAIRGSVGEVARVPAALRRANLTQDSARIAAWNCDPDWLLAALEAPSVQSEMTQRVTGATIKGINIGELRRVPLPVPSSAEQKRIGRAAGTVKERSQSHHAALERSIDLLTEYKSSLITAAVTGELDVSTAGSSIPG